MRIVFIGAIQFSEKAVAKLINMKAEVVGVCTLEKAPFNADLTQLCRENNIPVKYINNINSSESIDWI